MASNQNVLQAIGNALGGIFNHPTDPKQAVLNQASNFDQQMAQKGWTKLPNGSYYQGAPGVSSPTPTSTPMPATLPSSGGFKFQMGKTDYSNLAPQLQSVLKNTPLEPYINNFIQSGNKHGVDPRVLVTIANNESSLGKNYPTDSFNPFGYDASSGGTIKGKDGKTYVNVDQGLRNAGFSSLPMGIDALTGRFARQPTAGYKQFYQNPTIENLQSAYNANPAEQANYLKNANALVQQFK